MSSKVDQYLCKLIDKLKSGEGLEIIAALFQQEIYGSEVKHNQFMVGKHSGTRYQIDTVADIDKGKIIGEAKDYARSLNKVGRAEIEKLVGTLGDLPEVGAANFYSTTGYTKPAKKYAKSSPNFSKPIDLYEIGFTTEKDLNDFIGTVRIVFNFIIPIKKQAKFTVYFKHLTDYVEITKVYIDTPLDKFFDSDGYEILCMGSLEQRGYGSINETTGSCQGCFLLPYHFIKIENQLFEIKGLGYDVPMIVENYILEISNSQTERFTLKDMEGNILGFLSDEKIKEKLDEMK